MLIQSSLFFLTLSSLELATAQDLSVPTSWRVGFPSNCCSLLWPNLRNLATLVHSQSVFLSHKMRSTISSLSWTPQPGSLMVSRQCMRLSVLWLACIGIGYWQSGNVWSAMANQDRFAGTTTNKAQVVSNLNAVFKLRANYDEFGYACFHFLCFRAWTIFHLGCVHTPIIHIILSIIVQLCLVQRWCVVSSTLFSTCS